MPLPPPQMNPRKKQRKRVPSGCRKCRLNQLGGYRFFDQDCDVTDDSDYSDGSNYDGNCQHSKASGCGGDCSIFPAPSHL